MAKIAIATDFHFGVHGDSPEFLKYQKRFFDEQFFPYLDKNGIKDIISLGDEFHSRKDINYNTLHKSKEMLFDRVENEGYRLKIIVGNHSTFHKEHNEVNSPNLLFSSYNNIEIIEEPTTLRYGSSKLLLIPWINKNNESEILKAINDSEAEYLLGHFEIVGLKLLSNWEFSKGLDNSLIDKFKEVWSGHYHLKLQKNNFLYLGTPYCIDWGDVFETKGFYIFDTELKKLTFIKNHLKIFHIIEYIDDIDVENFDYKKYSDSYIRVVLNESIEGYHKFELFIKRLEEVSYEVKVNENFYDCIKIGDVNTATTTTADDDADADNKMGGHSETTIETIKKRCEEIEIVDKDKLFKLMNSAYLKSKELLNI